MISNMSTTREAPAQTNHARLFSNVNKDFSRSLSIQKSPPEIFPRILMLIILRLIQLLVDQLEKPAKSSDQPRTNNRPESGANTTVTKDNSNPRKNKSPTTTPLPQDHQMAKTPKKNNRSRGTMGSVTTPAKPEAPTTARKSKTANIVATNSNTQVALSSVEPKAVKNNSVNSSPNNSVLILDDGFERGIGKWREVPANYKMSNESREGNHSVHFLPDLSGGKRSELVLKDNKGTFEWGKEYWVGFSINVKRPPTGYQIISQHHSTPGAGADGKADWSVTAGPNSFTMKAVNGDFIFRTSTNPNQVNTVEEKGGATRGTVKVTQPYQQNQWHDIVQHFRYTPDNKGFMEIWMDGKKVVDAKGPTVYKYDLAGRPKTPHQYQKIGIYHGPKDPGGEILYDAFRVGGANASYKDVAPR